MRGVRQEPGDTQAPDEPRFRRSLSVPRPRRAGKLLPRLSKRPLDPRPVASVSDAYNNTLAESFADSFKDRADHRPGVETRAARTRERRLHRLVQRRPATRIAVICRPSSAKHSTSSATWLRDTNVKTTPHSAII